MPLSLLLFPIFDSLFAEFYLTEMRLKIIVLLSCCFILFPTFGMYAHIIGSNHGHSYGTVYTILYFIAKIIPFIGLGVLTQLPVRKFGYPTLLWQFMAIIGAGIVLGWLFHDYFSTAYLNYFLTVGIGFLMLFYSGKHPFTIWSFILLCCLSLGFDFGFLFSQTDAWLGYMISICVTAIAAFIGISILFITLNDRYQLPQQVMGVLLVITGVFLILLF